MQNLIVFLTKFSHWLLFILLEVVSVVLLFKYNGYQGSVWISSANSVAGQVYEWQSDVEQHFKLKKVNSTLASRNIALERELYQMRSALQELTDSSTIAFMADSAMQQLTTSFAVFPSGTMPTMRPRPVTFATPGAPSRALRI